MISENPAVLGGVAVATVLTTLFYNYYKYNVSVSGNENATYFVPTKSMAMKDTLIVKMLEDNETSKSEGKACWVITDPALSDNPIIYASEGFCRLTGYAKNEVEVRVNCYCRLICLAVLTFPIYKRSISLFSFPPFRCILPFLPLPFIFKNNTSSKVSAEVQL